MALRGAFDDLAIPVTGFLPENQFSTTSQASGAILATALVGACYNILTSSGATALTTPTAAQMYAQLVADLQVLGFSNPLQNLANALFNENGGVTFEIRIQNSNASTLTLTGGTGVTIVGTATIATASYRDYAVCLTSPTTATLTNLGGGTT
jgi:hypothetical protein